MKFLSKKRIVALLLILAMLLAVPVPLVSAEKQPVGNTDGIIHAGMEGWITDGVYYIRSAAEPDFVWSLNPDQKDDGLNTRKIVLDEYSFGNKEQMFVIQRDTSEEVVNGWEYRIRSVDTSVDNAWVDVPGGVVGNFLEIFANGYVGNSQLYIDYEGDGTFTFRSDTAGGNYVGKSAEGDSYSYLAVNTNGRDNMYNRWILEPATIPLDSQYYTIQTAVDTNYVLDLWNLSMDYGAELGLYSSNDGAWQHFYFQPTSDGYFTITSAHSNRFVSAPIGYVDASTYHTVVQLGSYGDGSVPYESKWSVIPNFDGTHSLVNAYNGMYLDLSGANAADDNMVGLWGPNGNIAQKWVLKSDDLEPGDFFNRDSGIYADSFDTSDTVSLPIKIFDYDNDGMLFEWSSSPSTGDADHYCDNEANGTRWAMGNNTGFTLLDASGSMRKGYGNYYESVPVGSGDLNANIYRKDNNGVTDSRELTGLGYELYQDMGTDDWMSIGLLQSTYNAATRTPLYKQAVVTYVANLLKESLEIPVGGDGSGDFVHHYNYVMGEPNAERYGRDESGNALDFAEWIRRKTNYNLGTYDDTAAKNLIGSWEQCKDKIETLHDAAYFMLNNLFIADSYNEPQSTYDYLVLTKATSSKLGRDGYVFDCGFTDCVTPPLEADPTLATETSSVEYDKASKTIRNTSAAGKSCVFVHETIHSYNAIYPMLPITDKNNQEQDTESPYWMDPGVSEVGLNGTDTYENRNFNFAIQSNGSFVYHEDEELFFDFAGDDDVYLFINGELVMDIGGGHTIATALIELNEYVQAARAEVAEKGDEASPRAKALALVEGNSYPIDFYYLERHGTAANMRIFTNIRVTDSSVEPIKKAYQDDIEVNYGGIVDADEPVEYAFALKNTGNAARYCLSFHDAAIGVDVSYDNGLVVTGEGVCDKNRGELDATDLVAVFTDANGNVTTTTFASEQELKTYLRTPAPSLRLGVGETVELRGIYYSLSEEQIQKGGFKNVVSITSMPNSDGSGTPIEVSATMQIFVPCEPRYYQWAGHELNVSTEKLIEDLNDANENENNPLYGKIYGTLTEENLISVKTCLSSGMEHTYKDFTVDDGNNLHINYPAAGSYSPYLKVTYSNEYGTTSLLVNVLVNVFDVKDSCYVLDYGLAVDLTQDQPLYANDTLNIAGVATNTSWEGLASYTSTPSYGENHITYTPAEGNTVIAQDGTFEMSNDTSRVTFKPTSFMEEESYCYLAVRVSDDSFEAGTQIGTVDINNEVEMYQKITIVPASVVYYEDNFPAITYTYPDENEIEVTSPSEGEFQQSADQSTPYGYDKAYAEDTNQTMSAGTLHKIQIPENYTSTSPAVAKFTFAGTGFELVSRTNAYDSASLVLKVKDKTGITTIKTIPVITEFNNNADGENATDTEEVYQVPVIRVEGLDFDTYIVEIYGVPMFDYTQSPKEYIPTYLYLDGIRIFDPVGGTDIPEEYYSDTEVYAEILEIRELALKGMATFVTKNDDSITLGTALSTFTENRNNVIDGEAYEGNTVDSIDEYLMVGPNNEVYLNGIGTKQALVLYVNEDELLETVSALQVAVRLIDDKGFYGVENDSAIHIHGQLYLGIAAEDGFAWQEIDADITSGTEQYYNVSFKDCPYIDGKGYQVVLRVNSGILSLTSIKNSGLIISANNGEVCDLHYQGGFLVTTDDKGAAVVVNDDDYPDFRSLRAMMFTPIEEADPELPPEEMPTEPEVPEEPIVDESLKFKSASLTLESDIAMNFYARDTVLEGWENPYVVFTKAIYSSNGNITGYETEKVSSFVRKADHSGVPCHCFRFDGVKAYEMGSQVTATLYAYKDGVLYKGAVVDYSVFKYASNMLKKTSDDALKTLLVDALNYGAAAQTYFEYNQENLVNEDLTEEQAALATAQNPAVTSCTELIKNEGATVSFKAVSLVLKDKVTFNYYLNLANYNGDIEDLELRISYTNAYGEEDTAVIDGSDFAYKRYTDGNYYYVANFSELYAFQMREICSAEVYSKTTDTVISSTVLYSIESYVASKTNSDQNALVQLLWDMMKYGDAAENYFKKN